MEVPDALQLKSSEEVEDLNRRPRCGTWARRRKVVASRVMRRTLTRNTAGLARILRPPRLSPPAPRILPVTICVEAVGPSGHLEGGGQSQSQHLEKNPAKRRIARCAAETTLRSSTTCGPRHPTVSQDNSRKIPPAGDEGEPSAPGRYCAPRFRLRPAVPRYVAVTCRRGRRPAGCPAVATRGRRPPDVESGTSMLRVDLAPVVQKSRGWAGCGEPRPRTHRHAYHFNADHSLSRAAASAGVPPAARDRTAGSVPRR